MRPTIAILVVGLSPHHLGPNTPHLSGLARAGAARPLATVTPAVTCSVQATFMTGGLPRDHGIVGNGWFFRDLLEVWLWRQSNRLVAGEKIWEAGKRRNPAFTTANLFWWYNIGASHDFAVTPRPIYKADGRKLPDCYTKPPELREELTRELGPFPLFQFWGPGTSIASSRWIADAALHIRRSRSSTLTLVYLPHLDYDLQRFGPDDPRIAVSLREIDAVVGDLIADASRDGARVIVLSEYGMAAVSTPIHVNRALREAGLLGVRVEDGGEILDVAQSRAFAVADHQIAHIYVGRAGSCRRSQAADRRSAGCRMRARPQRATLPLGSIIRARASLWPWRARMPGLPITTGWTIAALPILRALSKSIASPVTIRLNYLLIPPSRCRSLPSAGGWPNARWACAR